MLKLALHLLFFVTSCYAVDFTCPTSPITSVTLGGNLPVGATNITSIPKGTNCTFVFDIPNNYAVLLKFSFDFQSKKDTVTIYDNTGNPRFEITHNGQIVYDAPLWMSARSAQVQVIGGTGNSRFMLSYMYQSLSDYQQVKKSTGEHFALNGITGKTYYTITASSANEKVALNHALRAGAEKNDSLVSDYYVYDGDNLNTATYIGLLSEFRTNIRSSTGRSISIVNFYGTRSSSYALGNDASTVQGYSKYTIITSSLGSQTYGHMGDFSGQEALYTYICTDCTYFTWTQNDFESDSRYVGFRGQTPTHKREALIKYDAQTYSSTQMPQLIPSNVFTINLNMSRIAFRYNNINDFDAWQKPYHGRKGYIFSPSLWSSAPNNFNYEFRDDSQLFNFTMNENKMSFPANTDKMTLMIGTGTTGNNPAVDLQHPRDPITKVQGTGNYMQVNLDASVAADVRLAFEMYQTIPPTTTTRRPTAATVRTTTSGVGSQFSAALISVFILQRVILID